MIMGVCFCESYCRVCRFRFCHAKFPMPEVFDARKSERKSFIKHIIREKPHVSNHFHQNVIFNIPQKIATWKNPNWKLFVEAMRIEAMFGTLSRRDITSQTLAFGDVQTVSAAPYDNTWFDESYQDQWYSVWWRSRSRVWCSRHQCRGLRSNVYRIEIPNQFSM